MLGSVKSGHLMVWTGVQSLLSLQQLQKYPLTKDALVNHMTRSLFLILVYTMDCGRYCLAPPASLPPVSLPHVSRPSWLLPNIPSSTPSTLGPDIIIHALLL
jgi:hypothetical protein